MKLSDPPILQILHGKTIFHNVLYLGFLAYRGVDIIRIALVSI
jgi:hypothetical protein